MITALGDGTAHDVFKLSKYLVHFEYNKVGIPIITYIHTRGVAFIGFSVQTNLLQPLRIYEQFN